MSDEGAESGGCLLGVGGGLILLGAVNSVLALTVDTCTGGSADSLRGFIFTIPLYLVGFAMAAAHPRPDHVIIPLLISPIALWHSAFAFRFALGHIRLGISECDAFHGYFGESLQEGSGSEPVLIAGWVAASLTYWGGVLVMWLRARRRMQPSLNGT